MATPGRTTASAVRGIIETEDGADLTPYIDVANELVTEACAGVLRADGVTPFYSNHRLELIERWLAAHFYTNTDPRAEREKVGSLAVTNQGKIGLALDSSVYGQNVKVLDSNGGLAALDNRLKKTVFPLANRVKPSVKWLGEKYCNGVPRACP